MTQTAKDLEYAKQIAEAKLAATNTNIVDALQTPIADAEQQKQAVEEIKRTLTEYPGYCDLTGLCDLTNQTSDTIAERLAKDLSAMNEDERKKILQDPKSIMTRLYRCTISGASSAQSDLMLEALMELKELKHVLKSSIDTSLKDKSSNGGSKFKNELHGPRAALAFTARLRGLKKVYLYSSGFHVDIRPFELAELNEFYMSIDQEGRELGRILGGHFYLIHDLFIKQKFMELFPLCVVGSNLKGWDKGDTLAEAISINDYDTLLWAACSVMYKKGIRADLCCANSECNHTTRNILHDLEKMRFVDTSIMSEEAMEWMVTGKEVTLQDLRKYRTEILKQSKSFDDKCVRYHMTVPSIKSVLDYGVKLMALVTSKIQGKPSLHNETVVSRTLINYNRGFVPWIERIEMVAEDKSIDFSSSSEEAFHSVLEIKTDDPDDGTILTEFTKFMKSTRISYICHQAVQCELCKQTHPSAVDGMLAWDAQYLFFYLTYRKLEPIGIV